MGVDAEKGPVDMAGPLKLVVSLGSVPLYWRPLSVLLALHDAMGKRSPKVKIVRRIVASPPWIRPMVHNNQRDGGVPKRGRRRRAADLHLYMGRRGRFSRFAADSSGQIPDTVFSGITY